MKGLRDSIKRWTIVSGLSTLLICTTSCSQAVMLIHETENGGVATYSFKEDRGGPMGSPHRGEAVKLIEKNVRLATPFSKMEKCEDLLEPISKSLTA